MARGVAVIFCTACGTDNADVASFCNACGASIVRPAAVQEVPPSALSESSGSSLGGAQGSSLPARQLPSPVQPTTPGTGLSPSGTPVSARQGSRYTLSQMLIGAVVVLALGWLYQDRERTRERDAHPPEGSATLESTLATIARDINKTLPITDRDGVESVGAVASGRTLHMKYRLVTRNKDSVDTDALLEAARAQSRRAACSDPSARAALAMGAVFSKTYVDARHEHLITYTITAVDCAGSPPAE